ncbi:hypothetical protein [Actinoplanes lobatus]|uniref:DUF3592 domain-containing protein n=1 Tax=Actinoplanes lobatus TaxID=113568 RepID=A0A7W7HLD1_9ACTN|nr:hypothetical protein [Actinoplanes lobatus]MBB4752691.1 hypothetical protein [Actinoplanes lobatus]
MSQIFVRRVRLLACMITPALVAAVADIRGWRLWLLVLTLAVTLLVVGLLIPARTWKREDRYDKVPIAGMVFAALVLFAAMNWGARLIVLGVFGHTGTAHVSSVSISLDTENRGGRILRENCYRLTRLDGSPLPGTICRRDRYPGNDEFGVGDDITVLLDPAGLVAPEVPGRVRWAWIPGGLALASFAGLVWAVWRNAGRPVPEPPWQPRYVRQEARPRKRRVPKASRKRPPKR